MCTQLLGKKFFRKWGAFLQKVPTIYLFLHSSLNQRIWGYTEKRGVDGYFIFIQLFLSLLE